MYPYFRYVLAAHSIDQLILGTILGVWEGLVLHFLLRQFIIVQVGNIIRVKRSYINRQHRILSLIEDDVIDRRQSSISEANSQITLVNHTLESSQMSSSINGTSDNSHDDVKPKRKRKPKKAKELTLAEQLREELNK